MIVASPEKMSAFDQRADIVWLRFEKRRENGLRFFETIEQTQLIGEFDLDARSARVERDRCLEGR